MPEPKRRGRPVRPILARIAENIEGMDYKTLVELLKERELPLEHWVWTGSFERNGLSSIRIRRGTFETASRSY